MFVLSSPGPDRVSVLPRSWRNSVTRYVLQIETLGSYLLYLSAYRAHSFLCVITSRVLIRHQGKCIISLWVLRVGFDTVSDRSDCFCSEMLSMLSTCHNSRKKVRQKSNRNINRTCLYFWNVCFCCVLSVWWFGGRKCSWILQSDLSDLSVTSRVWFHTGSGSDSAARLHVILTAERIRFCSFSVEEAAVSLTL